MKKLSITLVLICVLLFGAFGSYLAAVDAVDWQQSSSADLPNPTYSFLTVTDDKSGQQMEYIVQMPRLRGTHDFLKGSAVKYPVMLFLHGSGGESLYKRYKTETMADGVILDHSRRSYEFPFIVITPLYPDTIVGNTHGWRGLGSLIMKAVDNVCSEYSVNTNKIYMGGFSMGGMGTYALAADYPTKFAACVVAAGKTDYNDTGRFSHIPFWIFHGTTDSAVPFSEDRKIADILQGWGKKVTMTELPVGHDLVKEIFSETTYNWLLDQTLQPDTVAPKKPFVDDISNDATFISGDGYGDPGAKVIATVNDKVIGTGMVNYKETYKVYISKQKIGTIVKVTLTDVWGNVSVASTKKVADLTAPAMPVIKSIKSIQITGKTEAYATIKVKAGSKVLGSSKAVKSGSFTVKFKTQKTGTSISVYSIDKNGNVSKAKKVKI